MGATIKITTNFLDGTSKTVSVGEVAVTAINENKIKQQVATLNAPMQRETDYPGFTEGYVSNAGANFASISAVEIITVNRTVIF